MLVVTTPILEGKKILEYKGPVFAQVLQRVRALAVVWQHLAVRSKADAPQDMRRWLLRQGRLPCRKSYKKLKSWEQTRLLIYHWTTKQWDRMQF